MPHSISTRWIFMGWSCYHCN